MKTTLSKWQPLIQKEIGTILADFLHTHSTFKLDAFQLEYLQELSQQGKQFRGCILAAFYTLLLEGNISKTQNAAVVRLAAAVELYGTGILIHDDIIDRSETRRGMQSIHSKMSQLASQEHLLEPKQFGLAAAICLADVLYFWADRVVAQLDFPDALKTKIAAVNGEELALLGLAEVEDTRMASSVDQVSKADIYKMYLGKTGRYTGRWPLQLASILADVSPAVVRSISAVGESIGVLYQLRDDELGLFGDAAITGKSTVSDIREGKKTLYYWHLQQLPKEKQSLFSDVFGNPTASEAAVSGVKELIESTGIRQKVHQEMIEFADTINADIARLQIPPSAQTFLLQVTEFVIERQK